MKVLSFILQKEFKQIFRDKTILAMMLVAPMMQLIILPLVANFDVKNINLVYIDHDQSPYSHELIQKITASGYFKLVEAPFSYKEGIALIEDGKADVVLEVPEGFERNLVREGKQPLGVSIDAINGSKSSLGGAYLLSVIRDFNTQLDVNVKTPQRIGNVAKIGVESTHWYNPYMQYTRYIVPGILAILLTIIGGFLSALNVVKEKEIGTIEQINVTPIKKWQFILGKLIPFLVVGIILFTLGLTVMYIVYGIFPAGSLLTLYAFAIMYLIAILGFGLLVSTYANSQLQAMFIAYFFIMIFLLMSGFLTSVDSMPAWSRQVSNAIPVTHFVNAMRLIVLKGSSFAQLSTEFLYLVGFAILLNSWAIWNYKKTS